MRQVGSRNKYDKYETRVQVTNNNMIFIGLIDVENKESNFYSLWKHVW